MAKDKPNTTRFPQRESYPGGHQADLDGKTSYGRDGETTYKD